jgi:hypothetical protein
MSALTTMTIARLSNDRLIYLLTHDDALSDDDREAIQSEIAERRRILQRKLRIRMDELWMREDIPTIGKLNKESL